MEDPRSHSAAASGRRSRNSPQSGTSSLMQKCCLTTRISPAEQARIAIRPLRRLPMGMPKYSCQRNRRTSPDASGAVVPMEHHAYEQCYKRRKSRSQGFRNRSSQGYRGSGRQKGCRRCGPQDRSYRTGWEEVMAVSLPLAQYTFVGHMSSRHSPATSYQPSLTSCSFHRA